MVLVIARNNGTLKVGCGKAGFGVNEEMRGCGADCGVFQNEIKFQAATGYLPISWPSKGGVQRFQIKRFLFYLQNGSFCNLNSKNSKIPPNVYFRLYTELTVQTTNRIC